MTPQPYILNQTYAAGQAYIMNPTYIPIPGYALPHVNPSMPGYDPQYSAYAFGDPFYAYPRVPVTPSLLCAYAHMRGRVDQEYDPLHQSLFATPSRAFQSGKLILPLIFKRASMEELPRGATYFWDPILETKTREQVEGKPKKAGFAEEGGARSHTTPIYPKGDSGYKSPPPTAPEGEDDIYDDFHLPSPKMDSQIYKEYIKNHPPRCIAPNHYKGDMVFANFGYVNIEGKWVDPESEGELYKAYMNPTEGSNSKIPLPTLRQRSDSGPRIMTPEEQLKFYNEYVMDITDWVDAEGDPRMLRITPATFLRWATGAVKGEHFEETLLAPQENLPDSAFLDGTGDEDNLFKLDHRVQFDLDTRSVLSGQYSPDPNPRPHRNPHGHTDVIRAPATFAYSYPQAALDLEKAAFGARSNDSTACSPVSTASTPETFTSEKAIISLAQNNIENLATAEAVYEKSRNYILHLREQQQDVTIKEMEEFEKKAKDAAAVRIDLNFEVFAMEAQIEALKEFKPIAAPPTPPTPFARTAIPTPQTTPEREAAEAAEAEDEEVYEPPVHQLRRTKQYKRYLREEIEREKIQCERVKQTDVRLQDDLQDIIDDIENLRKLKDDLVGVMQKATDDIRAQQENNYRVPRDPPGGLGREN